VPLHAVSMIAFDEQLGQFILGPSFGRRIIFLQKAVQIRTALRMTGYVEFVLIVIFLRKVERVSLMGSNEV
jgi:hypothetical protein